MNVSATAPSFLCPHRRALATATARVLASALLIYTTQAQTPSLLSNHSSYVPEEEIIFNFAGGPGNPRDWIAVYPEGIEPGSQPSTIWRYVNNTQTATEGLREGTVTFPTGLTLAGAWVAYFLVNEGYTALATNTLTVVEPGSPLVRTSKRVYAPGETIEITFTNGPANPKDWVGLYLNGQIPGAVTSTMFLYVDGTPTGSVGKADGTLTFTNGLAQTAAYAAHFLLDDGYDILASETFTVAASSALPRVLSINPVDGSSNLPPLLEFTASITNGTTKVVTNTVALTLDGVAAPATVTQQGELIMVGATNATLPAAGSTHAWVLTLRDDASPANEIRAESRFTIGSYRNVVLPPPLFFENFDGVPEGSLPVGWTNQSYTMPLNEAEDFGDLGSAAYGGWIAVNADRFNGTFITYSNPDNPDDWESDYQRVNRSNPFNVVNGAVLSEPLGQGRFLFGNSGYQNTAASQVLYLFTPDYDLTGKTNVSLVFKSLWEQNQDSIAALEYSVNQGTNWLPIAYFLQGPDVLTITNETSGDISIDAEATLNMEYGDVARYTDDSGNEVGGTYGAFIAAPISNDLAPYIQARVDDDPVESKRIEVYRLPQADNQSRVRFRLAHAGTDSWYWGIDDFGLYSITETAQPPTLSISRSGNEIVISWPADATGYVLDSTPTLSPPAWQPVPGVTGNSYSVTPAGAEGYFRLRQG